MTRSPTCGGAGLYRILQTDFHVAVVLDRLGRRLGELEAVMNLLRNGLLMRKTGDRRRTELTEKFAFLCGLSAEFITRSKGTDDPQRLQGARPLG
jgi:hypothetical protein